MNDVLHVVTFRWPVAADDVLDDLAAVWELQLATWRHPEWDACEVRIFCDTAQAALDTAARLTADLAAWLPEEQATFTLAPPAVSELPREDWTETWKRFFHTFRVSPRLVVTPVWEKVPPVPGEIVLEIDPGMSFGTGYHGTTRACLEFIDVLSQRLPGVSVLDVGTGSGILAMAAWKFGFRPVLACDNDPQAVLIAKENLERANCAGVTTFDADLEHYAPAVGSRIVIANILAPVLIRFAPRLKSFLIHDDTPAYLLLSGILDTQFAEVRQCFEALGFTCEQTRTIDVWTSGIFVLDLRGLNLPTQGAACEPRKSNSKNHN
jgi:ribosomal protein L11 methyltransferase